MADREVCVHLVPQLAVPGRLAGGLAVVIDVLRASTTIVHALAAGCDAVRPFLEVDEANEPALAFYASFGLKTVGRRRGYYPRASGGRGGALVLRCELD